MKYKKLILIISILIVSIIISLSFSIIRKNIYISKIENPKNKIEKKYDFNINKDNSNNKFISEENKKEDIKKINNNNINEQKIETSETIELIKDKATKSESYKKNIEDETIINNFSKEDSDFLTIFIKEIDYINEKYNELISYDNNFEKGKEILNEIKIESNKINELKTSNNNFIDMKNNYLKGIDLLIKGYENFFNYKDNVNDYLIKADEYFYQTKNLLKQYLNEQKQ